MKVFVFLLCIIITIASGAPTLSTTLPVSDRAIISGTQPLTTSLRQMTKKHHSEEPSTNMTTTVPSNNTAQPLITKKNVTQNNKQTPAPQILDKKTKLGNPHPVTTALLIVILVAVLACLVAIAIVIRTSRIKTKEPGRVMMGGLQDRDLPTGPPPQPPNCCVDEEDIYVDQDA